MTSEKNTSGVTVNTRLYDAGLLDDFFKAANRKDKDAMIALLISIEIEPSEAEKTADTVLRSPAFS